MDEFSITWSGKIFGNIKISAKNSREAKQRLSELSKIDLVKKSEIWDNEEITEFILLAYMLKYRTVAFNDNNRRGFFKYCEIINSTLS